MREIRLVSASATSLVPAGSVCIRDAARFQYS
jgi:hypothetical protein